jgi:transposase
LTLIEPWAARIVLAHPGKLRVIAESTRKSDKLDARVLAEFLALDMIPQAFRPTPRQREHRLLVRHRQFLIRQRTQVRNKIRRILSDHNADVRHLFTQAGLIHLARVNLSPCERLVVDQLLESHAALNRQIAQTQQRLRAFAAAGRPQEQSQRQRMRTIPGVGEITAEVVLAELGDIPRFRSAKQAVAYAGLAPGRRESAGKAHDLGITKQGSGLLRWVLVEAAWQWVRRSPAQRVTFVALKRRRGSRRAIVAMARRLLEVIMALVRSDQPYREPGPPAVVT